MADQRDDRRHQRDADDVVPDEPHQLADDRVEHARVRHDAEIQHREDEQRGGGAGAVKAGFDHRCEVVKAVTAAENQNQAQDRREDDEGDGGLRLAFEKCDDDGDDANEAENADDGITHGGKNTFRVRLHAVSGATAACAPCGEKRTRPLEGMGLLTGRRGSAGRKQHGNCK